MVEVKQTKVNLIEPLHLIHAIDSNQNRPLYLNNSVESPSPYFVGNKNPHVVEMNIQLIGTPCTQVGDYYQLSIKCN